MATLSLVRQVRDLAAGLNSIVRALPGLDDNELNPNKKDRASFLLELKAYYSLLQSLGQRGWRVTVERKGRPRVRFARNAATKDMAAHFVIQLRGEKYQVVHGTKIRDAYGKHRAPDISLQTGNASEDPGVGDVIAIWDAKLRGPSGSPCEKRISDQEFRGFLKMKEWLQVPGVAASQIPLAGFPPCFEVSGLITNGRAPSEPPQLFMGESVSIAEMFGDGSTPMKPSRIQHVAAVGTPGTPPQKPAASR